MKNRYASLEKAKPLKTQNIFARILSLLAFLVLGFAALDAQAQIYYFSNGNGNWNNAANWLTNTTDTRTSATTATTPPNATTHFVRIGNGHTITYNAGVNIGELVVNDDGNGGTLQFDEAANRTLTVSGNVVVNAGGTIQALGTNATSQTHTLTINNGGSLTNNGTLNLRVGTTVDVVNINLQGNLAGSGTSTFNNITFNGTNNQTITIGGTISNVQAVTYNNTGTAPNNQITNQSTAFTNALTARQTAAGLTNISTFTAGNYRHDNAATYLVSNASITVPPAMTITALQGTMNFAHDNASVPVFTLNGRLVVDGGTVNAGVNNNTTSEFDNSLLMNAANANITINSGTLNVGNTNTGFGNLRMGADNMSITINGGTLRTERWVIGSGNTDNHVITINGGLVQILPTVTTTNRVALQFVQGTLTMNGGQMRIGESLTSITGSNLVQLATAGTPDQPTTFTINNGSVIVAGNPAFTSVAAVNPFNLGGAGTANVTLTVGDGSGGASTASLEILPNLAPQLPSPVTRNILDMDASAPDINNIVVNSDGYIKVGGGNIGNFRLNGNNCNVTLNGGTIDVTASVQLASGAEFTVNSGTLNVGLSPSNGVNTVIMANDPTAETRFIINGGTVNVGDGNSSLGLAPGASPLTGSFGDGDNDPTFGTTGAYSSFEISGGTLNLNGRFTLNDANHRFIMTGGAFNINPIGDQDLTGTQNVLNFNRGIVQHSGGTITIINPGPNAGGNNTTTGVTLRTSALGDPAAGAFLTGSTTTANVNTCFTGTSTIRFGDGISTVSGSPEGFEVCLAPTITYNNFVVNNPSGTNRFIWLYTPTDNQTLNFQGDFNLIAGEVRQGRPSTPATPNVFVNSVGSGVFTLAANALYRIYNTNPGNPAPTYGAAANYSIDFNSTIEHVSNVASGQTVSLPTGVEYGNLTISGTGNRTVTSGNAVRNTLTLNQGVLIVGSGNLTMRNNSRLVRAGTNTQGIINAGNTLGQAAGDLFRIIYRGVSKNFLNEEFTGAGRKSLEVDLNVGETVTQNTNRTIVDLFLTQGTLNDGGNLLSVEGNISGNATHTSTGAGRIQLTGTGAQTIFNAPSLGNFRLNKPSGTATLAAGASPTINGVFDIVQDNNFLDLPDNSQLSFGLNASTSGTFNNLRMIRLSGALTAQGVRKLSQGGTDFTFPIGVGTRYTPARLSVVAATGIDFLTVTPIASEAPTNSAALALQYYWRVERGTNLNVTNISHFYQYVNSDVQNTVADTATYQAGRYNTATAQWTALTVDEVQGNVDLNGGTITTGGRILFPNVNYAEGLFTAGEGAKFNNGTVVAYYSAAGIIGNWNNVNSWRTDGFGGTNIPSNPPNIDNPVYIGANATIFLNTSLSAAVPTVEIQATGRLRLEVNPGPVSFGSVSGEGTLELRDDDNNGIQFPVGNFTSFLGVNGGTVEYGGAQSYTLPSNPTGYRNLVISGNGTTKTFPDAELTITGNLTVQGGATALLSDQPDGDIIITGAAAGGGNLTVTGSGSVLRFTNTNERTVEVRRNVTIGAGATFDVATTGTPVENVLFIGDNTSALGGNLVNNGTFDMNAGSGRFTNVIFRGTGNASITGSGATTEFHRLIVNKGTDQTATLTVPDVATLANFSLTAPANTSLKPLTIQNGTFVFNRPSATLELSTGGSDFTIPTTGALQVGGGTVQISSTTTGRNLNLQGRLRITGGNVNIGTDPSGVTFNSILYSSPSAELIVEGGALTVSTSIRANGGVLSYTQSGGTVTVGRYSAENGFPIFGITSGGQFNMTGASAVLSIVRGRNSTNTDADLLIASGVTTPTNPQGTIQIFTGDTPADAATGPTQLGFIYDINSAVRLPNVSIGVGNAVNYNVGARAGAGTQTLDIRGNLTINTTGTCQVRLWRINGNSAQDQQSVTIAGNFTLTSGTIVMADGSTFNVRGNFVQNGGNFNQGATPNANLLVGGNFTLAGGTFNTFVNTTFNGTTTPQVITRTGGSPATLTFQNFTLNNTASGGTVQLGAGTDLNITGNWTTTAGAFDAQTNARTVTFNGTAAQTITGTTDFYNLTINNAAGVTFTGGTLGIRNTVGSGGQLNLQNGLLDIGNNPMVIRNTDDNAVVSPSFNTSRMIRLGGTVAAAGVTKHYPITPNPPAFTFPVGTPGRYTPATLDVNAVGAGADPTTRTITVTPVAALHPQRTSGNMLNHYWRVVGSGFGGAGLQVEHTYTTNGAGTLPGTPSTYIGGYYNPFTWTTSPVDNFDEGPRTITYTGSNALAVITGDFTAGEPGAMGTVTVYYSRNATAGVMGGDYNVPATWSTDNVLQHAGGVASSTPGSGSPVVIADNHLVRVPAALGPIDPGSVTINGSGTLEFLSTTVTDVTGSNLGIVDGTGIIKVNVAGVPTATFTTNFLNNGGTIEYSGASYILPATPTTYGSLAVTGSNATRNLGANTNIINELSVGGAIAGVVITAGGSGYSVNDVVTFTGGNGRGAFGYVSAVGAGGAVTGITITNPGFGYTSPPTINIASSSGTGFSGVAIPSRGTTLNMNAFTANRSTLGGVMRLGLNATLTTGSADNFPANYASYQIAQNSTVNYNSAGAQTVSALGGASYGNISFSGGGTKTLAGPTTVAGNFSISAGGFSTSSSNHPLTVAGNFDQTGGTLTLGTSAITLNGGPTPAPPPSRSGSRSGTTVTLTQGTTGDLAVGMGVSGASVLANSVITGITNETQFTIQAGTGSAAAAPLTFSIIGNRTGNLTAGSPTISSVSTLAGLQVGMGISGAGIPSGTYIVGLSGTSITMSQNATASGTGVVLSFTPSQRLFNTTATPTFTFNSLTINNTGNGVIQTNQIVTVTNALALTNGSYAIGGGVTAPGNALNLNGTVTGSGTITGSPFSDLNTTGSGALGTLNFTVGAQTLRRLSVNRTGTNPTVTLGTNLTVGQGTGADSLYLLSGIIQTGSNTLTLANQAQFGHGNANAFVDGILAITYPTGTNISRFFPIAGSGIYRPLAVRGNPTAGAVITARMINTPPPGTPGSGLFNLSGVRYYRIDRTGTFGGTPRVQLSINTTAPADEPASNTSGLTVASTTDNPPTSSTVWQAGGNPSAAFVPFPAAIMSADIASITTTSPVYVTAASTVLNDNPLPVELVSFSIAAVDEGVKLKWQTASEVDNAGFILSRSRFRDGGFEEIASYRTHDALVGKGTSSTGGTYEFIDRARLVPGETYFYKLEDVDYNGVIYTTEIKEFTMPKEYSLSQNYPNPFNPTTTIEFNLRFPGRTVLEIYNLLGQKVMTVVDADLAAGSYRYQVNLSNLASGMYLYRLRSRDFVATKKMLLMK